MSCQPVRVTPSHNRGARRVGNRQRTARRTASVVAIALAATVALLVASLAAAATLRHLRGVITIATLSDRVDLITGGRALVRVELPAGTRPRSVRITLDGSNVSGAFAVRAGGAFEGLLTGVRVGRNVLKVQRRDGSGAELTITNHPISGPLFSGPRIEPWSCQPGDTDSECDHPTEYSLYYYSTNPATCAEPTTLPPYHEGGISGTQGTAPCFAPYDPHDRPASIPTITTDTGIRVPFVVRLSSGRIAIRFWRPCCTGPGLESSRGLPRHRGTIASRSHKAERAEGTTVKRPAKCRRRCCRTLPRACWNPQGSPPVSWSCPQR